MNRIGEKQSTFLWLLAALVGLAALLMVTWVIPAKLHSDPSKSDPRKKVWEQKMAAWEEKARIEEEFKKDLGPYMRRASLKDYVDWLCGFIEEGNEPSHAYDYPIDDLGGFVVVQGGVRRVSALDSFFVAEKDFELIPLYGARAMRIIVPKGVKFLGGELGHTYLYFMDEYEVEGNISWVPTYTNTHCR